MLRKQIILGPILICLFWYITSRLGLIDPLFLPTPIETAKSLWSLTSTGVIARDLLGTLSRLAVGFSIGGCLGIILGLPIGYFKKLYSSLEIIIDFFRSVPVASLFPLFLVFFGIGDSAKVATAAWATSFIVLVNTTYGVRNCKETRLLVAKSMRASKIQIFTKFVFPDSLPQIVAGLRTALSIALIVVVVTEMFMGTKSGLGKRIYNASLTYETAELYASIFVTGLLGYILNKLFVVFESKAVHWSGK